jgi:deoxyribonuclease-1
MLVRITVFLLLFSLPPLCYAEGNTYTRSFNKAVKTLEMLVYNKVPKTTIYCGATFSGKKITDANGFVPIKYQNRANKLEWEHVVAAEHFGQGFDEWHNHDKYKECTTKTGGMLGGRDCASKLNHKFQYMQADMYNLYPAIGAVNAQRSNMKFAQITSLNQSNGLFENVTLYVQKWAKKDDTCNKLKIERNKIEPPDRAKGIVARSYLYMADTYRVYRLSSSDKKLFKTWNKKYPVTKEECKRTKIIKRIQHSTNRIVQEACINLQLW